MLYEVKTTSEIFPVHLWPLQSIATKIPVSPRASIALWSHLEFLPAYRKVVTASWDFVCFCGGSFSLSLPAPSLSPDGAHSMLPLSASQVLS